jgi:hypothetical protein
MVATKKIEFNVANVATTQHSPVAFFDSNHFFDMIIEKIRIDPPPSPQNMHLLESQKPDCHPCSV